MNHILIAEDEHLIARLVEMTLTRAGYRCTVAEDGRTAADLIEKTDFDMAILDIMLPGLDGYDLLASLKPQGVPVIFLTAKSAVKDRVLGLRLGADDYITKPFAAEELVARMETVLRRTGRGGRELCAYDVVLDTVNHTARRNGEPVELSGKDTYIFVDIFTHISFDLQAGKGRAIATVINGRDAQFSEELHEGDQIELYWKEN